jgi:hypothetical protein
VPIIVGGMANSQTFTGTQATTAQTALRKALGLSPENFPVQAFIGMISDEIEQLRAAGQDDAAIAALVSEATGQTVDAETIARFYASPEARGHHGA